MVAPFLTMMSSGVSDLRLTLVVVKNSWVKVSFIGEEAIWQPKSGFLSHFAAIVQSQGS
jgi:hypothetical protein